MQFYPGDWMKDPAVRACSYSSKGLWADMLCLMWESPDRGYLRTQAGKSMGAQQIANATGGSRSEVDKLLLELQDNGVYSRTDDGCIFNRRMVRDESLSKKRRECGAQGGNPNLVNQNGTKGKPKQRQEVKQIPTPSTSSSSSTSVAAAAAAEFGWPLFAAAVRDRFPETPQGLIDQIAEEAIRVYPALTDDNLVSAVLAATKPKQYSAALYKNTIPEVIRTWASTSPRDSAAQ